VHKAGAKFNYDKAIWYNQQFLKHVDLSHLTNYFESYTTNQGLNLSTDFIQRYCEIFRDRISFVHDLEKIGNYLYHNLETIDIDSLKKKWSPKSLDFVNDYISKLDNTAFDSSNLEELFKELLANYEMGMGQMMPVFRIALTGIMQGPSVFDTMMLLGKEESQKRFENLEILTKEF
jgi:glutamyl/glutaminyl-tRNA synthetase